MSDMTDKSLLHQLRKLPTKKSVKHRGRVALSADEGMEVLRAIRRGVKQSDISATLGINEGSLHTYIGTWAMRHVALPEDAER